MSELPRRRLSEKALCDGIPEGAGEFALGQARGGHELGQGHCGVGGDVGWDVEFGHNAQVGGVDGCVAEGDEMVDGAAGEKEEVVRLVD